MRIGYLSGDFHQHATALLMIEMLEAHDRARFELHAYSHGVADHSPMRQRLLRTFHRFRDVQALDDEALARAIHADGIDMLVDLKGYTAGSRTMVLSWRPAPVQVSFLGYPGTSGQGFVDYLLSDRFVTPLSAQANFSEALACLPHSYQPHGRARPTPAPDGAAQAEGNLRQEALARLALADLVLDTWPYNAHTTASDALAAGVPLLTCAGDTFASRVAGSLLHAVGLPELVTTTPEAYEDLALSLMQDRPRLLALRAKLACLLADAALFDVPRYTRDLEALFSLMWARHCDGLAPAALDLAQPPSKAAPLTCANTAMPAAS